MEGVTNNKLNNNLQKNTFGTPCTGGLKLLHGSIGTYRKTKKNENSDNVLIMVKMCSSEPQTNPYDI